MRNDMSRTYVKLALQALAIILLFCPLFLRTESDSPFTVFAAFLSLVTQTPLESTYSFVGLLNFSLVFNLLIYAFLISAFGSLAILIYQAVKKAEVADTVNSILIYVQSAAFAVLGFLTTSTISTTLNKGNTLFYLSALLGKENVRNLRSAGVLSDSVLSSLYGSEHFDYWGFLKLRPAWYAAMAVLIVLTWVCVKKSNRSHG